MGAELENPRFFARKCGIWLPQKPYFRLFLTCFEYPDTTRQTRFSSDECDCPTDLTGNGLFWPLGALFGKIAFRLMVGIRMSI